MNIKKQLRRFYAFGFFACLRIPDAVWVVFLAARGYSLWEIGLAEGIFHIVSLLCEIPSGMAADLIGRRRSLAAAGVCGVISALFMAFSTHFFGVCLSMVFSALSSNLISGSDEALLYDSLLEVDRQEDYLSVNAHYSRIQNFGGVLSNAASLLAGVLSYIGFYLVDAAVCLGRIFSALSLREPSVTENQRKRQEHPFRDFGKRLREHIAQAADFLRTYPRIAGVMIADGLLTLPSFLTLMFLQQRLNLLGLDAVWLGIPVMCISLARVLGVTLGQRVQIRNLKRLYIICALLMGAGTVCAGAASIIPAVLGAMVAAASMDVWVLHLQNRLNGIFPSDRRATLISVNMMAYSVLMVVASPVVGWLSDMGTTGGMGLCVLGAVVAAAGIMLPLVNRKRR